MIEVLIRVNVCGRGERYYDLGKVEIINKADHKDHPRKGNYKAILYSRSGKKFRTTEITDHPRLSQSIWSLLKKAIRNESDPKLHKTLGDRLDDYTENRIKEIENHNELEEMARNVQILRICESENEIRKFLDYIGEV